MKYPLVKIEWLDSAETLGWHYKDDINFGFKRIVSVGYLVKDEKEYCSIAPHITDTEDDTYQCCGLMCIPKCSIIKKRKINENLHTKS